MSEITLFDGAIGQELVNRHDGPPSPLWGQQVMIEAPEVLTQIHLDYFAAGATIATANTYNLLRDRLAPNGLNDAFEDLHQKAMTLALDARERFGSGQVALSLGPLGASYRPDLAPPPEEAAELYAEIVRLHGDAPDILLIETASSIDTARGALMGASVSQKPIWLGISVEDDDSATLRSGEPVAEAIAAIGDLRCDRILFNCSTPEAIDAAIAASGLEPGFGAYANGFTRIVEDFRVAQQTVDVLQARTDLGPAAYTEFAMGWAAQGARILGGCCEVGPAHIAHLANALREAGHTIV